MIAWLEFELVYNIAVQHIIQSPPLKIKHVEYICFKEIWKDKICNVKEIKENKMCNIK